MVYLLAKVNQLAWEQGQEAHLVGGFLRDLLLGRPSRDVDLVVSGRGEALARKLACAAGGSFVLLDPEHDVSRVVINNSTGFYQFDITGLGDRDLAADLRRRDFTINAMALPLEDFLLHCLNTDSLTVPVFLNSHRYSAEPSRGPAGPAGAAAAVMQAALIDPLGGLDDLRRSIIRACGPRSLEEDPLRALRAARLAGQLGFGIEPGTLDLIRNMPVTLSKAAPERILEELVQILLLPAAWAVIDLLDRVLGVLVQIFPEINPMRQMDQNGHHVDNVWVHSLKTLRCFEAIVGSLKPVPDGAVKDNQSGAGMDIHQLLALPPALAGQVNDYLRAPVTRTRSRLPVVKLACLFHDVGKLETRAVGAGGRYTFYNHHAAGAPVAAAIGRRLRLSGREADLLSRLVRGHMDPLFLYKSRPVRGRAAYRFFRRLGDESPGCLLLSLADIAGSRLASGAVKELLDYREFITSLLHRYGNEPVVAGRARPLLTGRDICRLLNIKPSPLVGRLLEELNAARAEGQVSTRQEAENFIRNRGTRF
ncbi:MAG: CCA tRNA nucleotidyltransferase [Thermoanaerobacteraceae bacterium]|nr:CCA tRNA nucleotidyltransferase [Thermoanaerobacteraceae bacterium]